MILKGKIMLLQIIFSSTFFVTVKANGRILYNSPKFHSVASESDDNILYYFTCTMFNLPDGGFLQFHVNQRSIDTLRFYNNTCYNRFSKCSADTCSCSYDNFTFRWYYSAKKTNNLNRFEVEMILIDKQLGKIQTTLSRTYNKTAIMDMDNDWNLYPNFNELRQETKDIHVADKGNGSSDLTFEICLVVIGLIVGMMIPMSIMRILRLGCFQRKRGLYTETETETMTQ